MTRGNGTAILGSRTACYRVSPNIRWVILIFKFTQEHRSFMVQIWNMDTHLMSSKCKVLDHPCGFDCACTRTASGCFGLLFSIYYHQFQLSPTTAFWAQRSQHKPARTIMPVARCSRTSKLQGNEIKTSFFKHVFD